MTVMAELYVLLYKKTACYYFSRQKIKKKLTKDIFILVNITKNGNIIVNNFVINLLTKEA